MKPEELNTRDRIVWCPGCGNYGILAALKNAIIQLGLNKEEIVLVSGIGCSSQMPHFINTYGIHSIHGRPLPVATGVRLANTDLKVIAVGGDGDGYGIGGGHFIHTMRRNLNITYIVCDNKIYGLTTGQASPTSDRGFKTKSSPEGVIEQPVNPIALAITMGATYVARGFAGDVSHLTKLIADGIKHKGTAFIDVLQPCVTFNHVNTYEFYNKRVYKLTKHNTGNKFAALKKAFEDKKIPIGLFYKEERQTYEDELKLEAPLAKQDINNININDLMDSLM